MLQTKLEADKRAFLMVALLTDRKNAGGLITYFPPSEQAPLLEEFNLLSEKTKEAKREIIFNELKRMSAEGRQSPLADIHADWIAEALKKEMPRTIATILRHLPGDKVSHVLDRLPPETLKDMPSLSDTFALEEELVQVLKRRFEGLFVYSGEGDTAGLNALARSSPKRLEQLFRDLGFKELALAFQSLHPQTVQVLLVRLPGKDAQILKSYMERQANAAPERLKQAQNHLIALKVEKGDPSVLILEAGFFVYSKALLPEHLEGVRMIQQKFPLPVGRMLKRYVEQSLPFNTAQTAQRYQREIMESFAGLAGSPAKRDNER